MHSVVFTLSIETFDDLVRREFCRPPDQGLLALAGSSEIDQLTVVDPWRSILGEIWHRRTLRRRTRVVAGDRTIDRVRPHRLRRSDPTDPDELLRSYRRLDARLERLATEHGAETTCLVSYHPLVAAHCGHGWADRRIFVARDDWASAPRKRPYWPAYRDAYARIAKNCTDVFTVSDELAQRVAPGRAQVLPNGVDARLWSGPAGRSILDIEEYAIYSGSIEVRLDLDLVDEILKAVPNLVLAGVVPDPELHRALSAKPGVHLTGALDQATLAAVVQRATVGVIPHHVTPLTAAMSPLKLYEYLAAGLPIVSTDLPGVREARELSDRIWLCGSASEWQPALHAALAAGRASQEDRARVLDQVSWDARLKPLVAAASRPQ